MRNRDHTILGGIILALALGVSLASHGATPDAEVSELKVTIHEWDVPTKGAHPHDPAVGPDGALWFTEQMANKLGRLDPATGTFKEYSLIEGKNSGPHGLVADKDGNIWYTANFGGYIGKLDPRTGKIELKKVQTESALPYGIQINSKGVPFFCELGTNKMGKIDPATMGITEYKLPEGARPRRLAIAADDKIYFTDFKGGNVGRLDPLTGAVKMWPSPGGHNSGPYGIAITPDGMVWYSESGVKPNTIIQFDPKTDKFARAAIPSGGGVVRNMAATADGRVYIACSGVDKVGVVERVR
ncbi:MAG: hypothetical protein E6K20_16500 [Gammaproteobacteria bacterium]|nr:MAG: hypothetical protein E6K20_16500 [Gammaproteobacteria bacterium]